MGEVIRGAEFRGMPRQRTGKPCQIFILPVVRIQWHPDKPGRLGKRLRRLRQDMRKYKTVSDLP
jgi:hypothetical protein